MLDLRKLNKEQREAVIHKDGPLIIVAGPGTGKTAVITSRISFLIKNKIDPKEILALTFSNKAAEEMLERVENNISSFFYESWISTFHSFAEKILRNHALDIGLNPDFKIIQGVKGWILVKQNLQYFNLKYYHPLNNPTKFISNMISFFNRLKDEDISSREFILYSKKDKDKRIKELSFAYEKYQYLLLKNNLLDFNDLINYSIEIFKKRPEILDKYKKQFKYFLIDEFQDINHAQYKLIKLLTSSSSNILIAYDSNQSIYHWRGASNKNINEFKKDFPRFKKITLIKNYRSFQNILDLSYKISCFIDKNNSNKLISNKRGKGLIEYLHFRNINEEIEGIFKKIIEIKDKGNDDYNDFAILTRTNSDANLIARFAEKKRLPYYFIDTKGLYEKPIIIDFISYFKLLDNYHENQAVYRVLSFSCWKIPPKEIIEITQHSNKFFISIWQSIKKAHLIKSLSKETIKKLKFLTNLIEKQTITASRSPVSEVFVSFLYDSKYLSYLTKNKNLEDLNYVNQFFERIKKFENLNSDSVLKNFIEEIKLEIEAGENGNYESEFDFNKDSIKILTIHTAKGLEFNNIFIFNLVNNKFPLNEKNNLIEIPEKIVQSKKEDHLIEERKLFYVAVTRASKRLFFTSSENKDGVHIKKISKFLIELGYSKQEIKSELNYKKDKNQIKKDKINYKKNHIFSYTQIKTFLTCPLQYQYSYIIKIPIQKSPSLVFGKSIHNTLYDFNLKYSKIKPDFKKLSIIYKKNWKDEWYNSKNERDKYYQSGLKILKNYYNQESWPLTIYEINNKKLLESSFTLNIGKYHIKGKIDRIDKTNNGIEIIDYKTGISKKTLQKEDKLQLIIYEIAVKEFFNISPYKSTLYYLGDNKKVSFLSSEKEIIKIKKMIMETIKEIEKNNFMAKPGWDCKYCNYSDICNYKK
jgi:DNA helicase II / ATP-dependent DNA helicase PcrA